jgi:hypothetical protein
MATANIEEKKTTKERATKLVENYQYYFKEENKDGSSKWMCKNNKCSASITINNQSIVKVCGKKLALEML